MQKDPSYADQVRIDPADYNPKKDRQGKAKEDAFETWANKVVEGTWGLPTDKDEIEELKAMMQHPIDVGTDAMNATQTLSSLGFGDDSLYDELGSLYDREGERADARPIIKKYVMQMLVPKNTYTDSLTPEIKQSLKQAVQGFKDPSDKQMSLPGMKQKMFAGEKVTFEDIKPYVSMYKGDDGKTVFDVLNKDGDSVKKFSDAKAAMEYLHKNFDALRKGEVQKENPEANQDMSMDYEFTGDDGEMAYGTLHYKVVNGQVVPDSLKGESEYNGNHKVDDELATDMVKPGGSDHEDALKAAQEDYDYESDRMRSKFEKDGEDKIDVKIDPDGGISKDDGDKSFDNKEETVEDFVKSFFDYTTNQFPKGETAVLTSVEKKFGDGSIKTAQETISKLMQNKDPEIAKIKKLAGI
jgi:hypothetical protein